MVWKIMRQLVYSLSRNENLVPFHLWWRETVLKSEKICKCFFFRLSISFSCIFYFFENEWKNTKWWAFTWNCIRKGITCEKTLCYLCNSTCRWCTVENAKIFWIFSRERNCKIFIGFFIRSCFFTKTIKQSLHQLIFLPYRTFMGEE